MAEDGVGAFVQGACGDAQPEWWEALRQLQEKMQNDMRLQREEMQAALDQKVQEANRKLEEAEKRTEKNLKSLEKRVADLEGRWPATTMRGSAGGQGEQEVVRQAMYVTPTEATEQHRHESVRHRGRILDTLLVSPAGTGEQAVTQPETESQHRTVSVSPLRLPVFVTGQVKAGIVKTLHAQGERSMQEAFETERPGRSILKSPLGSSHVVEGQREVEHLEEQMTQQEELMQKPPESMSHRMSVFVSQQQMPVLAPEDMEVEFAEIDLARPQGTMQGASESMTQRGSALESPQEMICVPEVQGEVEHPETDMALKEELMRQAAEFMSHRRNVPESLLQTPVLAPGQGGTGLAEGPAQAAPESAGPSGGTSQHRDRRRPEAPSSHSPSRTSSSPSVVSFHSATAISAPASASHLPADSEEQDTSLGVTHAGPDPQSLRKAVLKAVIRGREGDVRRLLFAGADVNCAYSSGKTLLMLAAERGYLGTVVLLLNRGADVNAATGSGLTPLHFAGASDTTGKCVSALLKAGANRDSKDVLQDTPLHLAVFSNNENAALELVKGGASRASRDNIGKRPYDYAKTELLQRILCP